ncbi:hypothetical protein MKW94_007079, partial [Papaver nudicaule]|nr:hypothetical protein [Papaver nudicaule]
MRWPRGMRQDINEALSIQDLGQGIELQLGLVVESIKATLSVKKSWHVDTWLTILSLPSCVLTRLTYATLQVVCLENMERNISHFV